jgi:uncharacterized membrane-anchored protein YitT (DUF2179 family)
MKKLKLGVYLYDVAAVVAGAMLFSASMNMFLLPAQIVIGGMTGIATVINLFLNVPIGIMIILLNIPLLILNTWKFGGSFLTRTLIGIVSTSLAIDFILIFPVTITDPLLCSLFGGLTMGAALGILLSRGFTTGGTDLIATLLKLRFKHISTGTLIMVSDLVIIISSAIFTKNYDGIFYAVISIYAMGKITDIILLGSQRAEMAFIISSKPAEISSAISEQLGRGMTLLDGHGGFTQQPKRVIMCVVGKRELFFLKQLISSIDQEAFVIICEAKEVLGEGFRVEKKK